MTELLRAIIPRAIIPLMTELLRGIIPQVIIPWEELFREELLYGNVLFKSHTFLVMTSVWLGTVEEVRGEEAYFRAGAQRRRTLIVLFGTASK